MVHREGEPRLPRLPLAFGEGVSPKQRWSWTWMIPRLLARPSFLLARRLLVGGLQGAACEPDESLSVVLRLDLGRIPPLLHQLKRSVPPIASTQACRWRGGSPG